jgi:glycosyltransferase involved in cell wall biosynthesis
VVTEEGSHSHSGTPLSAVIITFNEERNILRCLETASGISDEIVVVDSFSTDRTAEICRHFPNVIFIQRPWQGYAQTKNWANQQTTHDYILSLDADEVPDEPLQQSIKNARISGLNGLYELNRLTNYCGHWVKHCGWYPDKKIRVFPKSQVKWDGDFVHETLQTNKALKVSSLKGHLLHYSYHTLEDHKMRIEKYATLNAQKLFKEGKHPITIKRWIAPIWKFYQVYFIKLGFLDGLAGFHIARLSAKSVYLKYEILANLYRQKNN